MAKTQLQVKKVNDEKLCLEDIKKDIGKLKKTSKKHLLKKTITIIFQIIVIINLIVFTILPNAVKIVFDNAVVKITPYVSEVEINKLKSDWMRMESEKDYIKIDEFIEAVMESENYKERQVYEND